VRKYAVLLLIAAVTSVFFIGRSFLSRVFESVQLLQNANGGEVVVRVVRVIDGDTIEVETGDRVRYIGMDAPETVDPRKPVQCFGAEASKKNRELVEGKSVRLKRDISDRDAYGRLLRYAYLQEGQLVNLELVRQGYARALTFPPDVEYADEFVAAEESARRSKLGLWSACVSKN